ncbi:MFS transporter, partial [Kibdelosporangium lantanae]
SVAGTLVAPNKQASAIAMMFTGLTVANVLGVPLGTALGHALGWRSTFWAVAALGAIAFVAVLTLVPDIAADRNSDLRRELGVFRRPQVWLALATTSLGWAGIFASFTYITPMMTGVAGFSPNTVTWLLVLFGVGLVAGHLVARLRATHDHTRHAHRMARRRRVRPPRDRRPVRRDRS